jgi:enamine deaminase RidA (YjgF/YER057c/UK114 family)
MTRRLISSGSSFEEQIGYSRAVVDGDFIFVSGTTGYDYATMSISDSVVEQCEQCFRNIEAALAQAGATLRDVVRATFIVPSRADWEPCWPVIRKYFGDTRPASTMFHADLQTDKMRIEIEVTARLRRRSGER